MVLNIFALLFVLGVTFMNSMFGLFSGLINLFCCVASVAVAFGVYEPLNQLATGMLHLHPSYTAPFALVLPFAVTLLVLRLLADNLIRGNIRVPMYLDWFGGSVCGFLIAQLSVGTMALGFLMLPWGGRVAMFQPVERFLEAENRPDTVRVNPQTDRVEFRPDSKLWLRSDRFTVAVVNMLSSGSLSNWEGDKRNDFASVYPDFSEWVTWTGNTVQPESATGPYVDDKGDGVKSGIKVDSWWEESSPPQKDLVYRKVNPGKGHDKPAYEPFTFKPDPRMANPKYIGVRLTLSRAAADRDPDLNAVQRFRPTMIRLVGDVGEGANRIPKQYDVQIVGGADPNAEKNLRVVDPDANFTLPAAGDVRIDVYFVVDAGFKPRFIEYRRFARAALPPHDPKSTGTVPAERLAAAKPEERGAEAGGTGAFRFIDKVMRDRTGHKDDLPLAVSEQAIWGKGDTEVKSKLLVSGRIMGDKKSLQGESPEVTKFQVPEGKWICQVGVQAREVKTLFGKIMNFVGGITNQYQAVDREGGKYWLAGYYALAKRGDQEVFELFFTPDPEGSGWNGMLDWKEIKASELEHDDTVWGLIFVVPKGKCIKAIESGGGKNKLEIGEDLCE